MDIFYFTIFLNHFYTDGAQIKKLIDFVEAHISNPSIPEAGRLQV
jgi:hypothetical protein